MEDKKINILDAIEITCASRVARMLESDPGINIVIDIGDKNDIVKIGELAVMKATDNTYAEFKDMIKNGSKGFSKVKKFNSIAGPNAVQALRIGDTIFVKDLKSPYR